MSDLVLVVEGLEHARSGEGRDALRAAVEDITQGGQKLRNYWTGAKIYDRFGVQGLGWTEYGMGPKHGAIVMRIGLTADVRRQVQANGALTPEQQQIAYAQLGYVPDVLDRLLETEGRSMVTGAANARHHLDEYIAAVAGHDAEQARKARECLDLSMRRYAGSARHVQALREARRLSEAVSP